VVNANNLKVRVHDSVGDVWCYLQIIPAAWVIKNNGIILSFLPSSPENVHSTSNNQNHSSLREEECVFTLIIYQQLLYCTVVVLLWVCFVLKVANKTLILKPVRVGFPIHVDHVKVRLGPSPSPDMGGS